MLEKNPNVHHLIKNADIDLPLSDACLKMASYVDVHENKLRLPVIFFNSKNYLQSGIQYRILGLSNALFQIRRGWSKRAQGRGSVPPIM